MENESQIGTTGEERPKNNDSSGEVFLPKLRKNRRIECRWGMKYYTTVKNAVFDMRDDHFLPAPPPSSDLLEDHCEALYACKQCKDCFRFESSLEQHVSRRSWILGYWCVDCFAAPCTHQSNNEAQCAACIVDQNQKKRSMRGKGLQKGQKLGFVTIFYNQCQFFAHLRSHQARVVDMSDIMLMPWPVDVQVSEYSDLERACTVVMDRMFLKRIHIMDWLRVKCLGEKWWKYFVPNSTHADEQFLAKIFSTSETLNKNSEKKPSEDGVVVPNCSTTDMSNVLQSIESVVNNSWGERSTMSLDSLKSAGVENARNANGEKGKNNVTKNVERNKKAEIGFPSTDIAFVDCGSVETVCSPDVAVILPAKKKNLSNTTGASNSIVRFSKYSPKPTYVPSSSTSLGKIAVTQSLQSLQANFKPKISVRQFASEQTRSVATMSKGSASSTPIKDSKAIVPNKCITLAKDDATKSEGLKNSTTSLLSGKKSSGILTFQGSKNTDLPKILGRLPPSMINGKKIVFISSNSEPLTVMPKTVVSGQNVFEIRSEIDRPIIKLAPMTVSSTSGSDVAARNGSAINPGASTTRATCGSPAKDTSLEEKLIFKNGKTYLVRQTKSSSNVKLRTITKPIKVSSFVSHLSRKYNTPIPIKPKSSQQTTTTVTLPSISEHSVTEPQSNQNDGSCGETASVGGDNQPRRAENSSTAVTKIRRLYRWAPVVSKCRQHMVHSLSQLSQKKLRRRIDHLTTVNAVFHKQMGPASELVISGNVEAYKHLQNALSKSVGKMDQEDDDLYDVMRNLKVTEKSGQCFTCSRPLKPISFLVGVSKPPSRIQEYCKCQDYVCHLCNLFQGNFTRWKAHLNFHRKQSPFTCPECFHKFPTFHRLEAHIWTTCFHVLARRWFSCRICQIDGFLDMESVTKHFILTHAKLKLSCPNCNIFLSSKNNLAIHQKESHSDVLDALEPNHLVACAIGYCIVRLENYRAHMIDHIGVLKMLYYKCPFCSFLSKVVQKGREQIKYHLFTEHAHSLSELMSPETFVEIMTTNQQREYLNSINSDVSSTNTNSRNNERVSQVEENFITFSADTVEREKEESDPRDDDACLDDSTSSTVLNYAQSQSETFDATTIEEETKLPKIVDVRSILSDTCLDLDDELLQTHWSKSKKVYSKKRNSSNGTSSSRSLLIVNQLKEAVGKEVASKNSESQKIPSTSKSTKTSVREFFDSEEESCHSGTILAQEESCQTNGDATILEKDECYRSTSTKESKGKVIEETDDCIVSAIADSTTLPKSFPEDLPQRLTNSERTRISLEGEKLSDSHDRSKSAGLPESCVPDSKDPALQKNGLRAQLPTLSSISDVEEKIPSSNLVLKSNNNNNNNKKKKHQWRIALNAPLASSEVIDYSCHLCGECINTSWSVVREHFESVHAGECKLVVVTPRLLRMTADFIDDGYKEVLSPKKRKSDGTQPTTKRRRRWNPKKHVEKDNMDLGLCVQPESVQDREGNFKCKKCEHCFNDISQLRTHIATNHRLKDHYLMCLECGENFVVEPSLRMHLKAFHGILDPELHMRQNDVYSREVSGNVDCEPSTGIPNQCHVCKAVFEDKSAVDKHLRVHGMAFLNRKRLEARNAARNSEKKIKLDPVSSENSEMKNTNVNNSEIIENKKAESVL